MNRELDQTDPISGVMLEWLTSKEYKSVKIVWYWAKGTHHTSWVYNDIILRSDKVDW